MGIAVPLETVMDLTIMVSFAYFIDFQDVIMILTEIIVLYDARLSNSGKDQKRE